ncbi:MAG: hypothetical protein ACLU8W_02515 [Clostridia bacterium]
MDDRGGFPALTVHAVGDLGGWDMLALALSLLVVLGTGVEAKVVEDGSSAATVCVASSIRGLSVRPP